MTKFIVNKKDKSHFLRVSYKLFIFIYSFYIAFSSQAFAFFEERGTSILGKEDFIIQEIRQEKISKIENYFNRYNLPLAQHAESFVISAEKYDIDWRLVAAISFIESTGGKFACKKVTYNPFGWGSCKIGFNSYDEAIDYISMNLAGMNEKTSQHYLGKDIRGILEAYNPPSIVPDYADKVINQMEIINSQ